MSAQLIEEWNGVFTFQLTAAGLQQPTEAFLFGAISCLLQKMQINVSQMDEESCGSDENRHRFRAEFCQYVNQLIKISNPKDHFVYYDLVCPTAKKTVYVLKLLLNFYYFYGMIADEVIGAAVTAIDAYETAQLEVNRVRRQQQIRADRQKEVDQQLEFLRTRIPYVQKTIDDLQQRSARVKAQITADQRQLTDTKLEYLAMQQRLQEMRDQMVTDREAEDLFKALADLDAELVELNETERTTSASHREVSEQIGRVTSNIEAGERFLERFGVDAMTAAKTAKSTIAVAKQELATASSRKNELTAAIRTQKADNASEQQLVDEFEAKQSHTKQRQVRELAETKRQRKQAEQQCAQLARKLLDVTAEVEAAEEEHAFISTESARILELMVESGMAKHDVS